MKCCFSAKKSAGLLAYNFFNGDNWSYTYTHYICLNDIIKNHLSVGDPTTQL